MFIFYLQNKNCIRTDRLLTGAGPSTVPELTQMEKKALAIIGENSCDGISGGIDLRRGDAGRSQARRSPSLAARTSPALRISEDRPADTSSPLRAKLFVNLQISQIAFRIVHALTLAVFTWILLIQLEVEEQLNRNKSYTRLNRI